MSANTGPAEARGTHSSPPMASRRGRGPPAAAGATAASTSTTVIATRGGLMRKIARQEAAETSHPPASGPMTKAMPVQAVQAPMAAPRSSPLKVAVIVASAAGGEDGPGDPCSARAAIRVSPLQARAHTREVAPKAISPPVSTRRLPNRSASEPPSRISEPRVRR